MRSFRSRGADERKAMFAHMMCARSHTSGKCDDFANMLNSRYHPMVRFAEEAKPVAESVKVPSPPLEVPESPISGGSHTAEVLPHGENLDIIDIPKPEDVEFDMTSNIPGGASVGRDSIPTIKGEIPPIDISPEVEHGSVEPEGGSELNIPPFKGEIPPIQQEIPLQEEHWDKEPEGEPKLNVGTPPPVFQRKDDFLERVGAGFYSGLESGEKQLEANILKKSSEFGRGLTSGELELAALRYPGKKLKSMHIPAHLKSLGRQAVAVALPASEAFGATAGAGVTGALRATGNLITDPGREFYIPPGYQRVWTGEGDNYKMMPISTPQMQPAHFVAGMGAAMPPGVYADSVDIAGAAKGSMNAPFFRQIDDVGKSAEVKMGTLKAGKIMERSRSDGRALSPMERISRMGFKEASEAFMAERGGGRPREAARESSMYQPKPKSDKQIMSESILSMPMMQAAEGFMKHAKVEISRPSAPVYVQHRQVAPTMPVRVEIPLSSGSARGVMA